MADRIQKLYAYMSDFFHDEGHSYRVFIRKDPYTSGNGTALIRSFMFSYSEDRPPTVDGLQGLLSHEMAHNWPSLQGPHAATAWYSEGTAEFYSIVLSRRAGLLSLDDFLEKVNGRASGYYTNPLQTLSNDEAGTRFWNDTRAQRVPYGRGFMYLVRVNAQIRAHSDGQRSLDDIVRELYAREQRGEAYGIETWLDLAEQELGPEAATEYQDMAAGKLIVPPENAFGPCFRPERQDEKLLDLGFDIGSLNESPRVVHGLVPGSAAARAGLRNGDEIVTATRLQDVIADTTIPMVLQVRRGGGEFEISYEPRGKSVESYRWTRVEGVPEDACGI